MTSRRLFVIDGYNVLRAGDLYDGLAERDMEAARTRLVGDVAAFVGGESEAVVVFDAAENPRSDGSPHSVLGITVRFSPAGVEADAVIERLARDARRDGRSVIVVTSDATMQWTVMGEGVERMSAAGFVSLLADEASDIAGRTPAGERRAPLSDRIDPDIRRRLDAWARG